MAQTQPIAKIFDSIGITGLFSRLGSLFVGRTAVAADYDALESDYIIAVTSTGAPVTVTIKTAQIVDKAGREIVVKDEGGGAGTDNITVATEASETIDGAATSVISTNYGSVRFYSDGADLFIV